MPMPTPSITANKQAHPIAELRAAFMPPRAARAPPVKKPAITVGGIQVSFKEPILSHTHIQDNNFHRPVSMVILVIEWAPLPPIN